MTTTTACHSLVAALFFLGQPRAAGQGALNPPPGPPAPTMKTLDQVEARTLIDSAPITISASGSYYLTRNLSVAGGDAITIAADNVAVDLNGFTISSTSSPAGGTGIFLAGSRRGVTIRNGNIAGGVVYSGGAFNGPGFQSGIAYQEIGASLPVNTRVSDISVSGCMLNGIRLSNLEANLVESCLVTTVGGFGIVAGTVSRSRVSDAGEGGISGDMISDCYASVVAGGTAVFATSVAENCYGFSRSGTGVHSMGIASRCRGRADGAGQGVRGVVVTDCMGQSFSSQGILANTATNCYGSSDQNRGISTDLATNCVGSSNGGSFGINASRIANNSFGSSNSGTGLASNIVIGCTGINLSGAALSATFKYNAP